MGSGPDASSQTERKAFQLSDALLIAAVPIIAFIIVALFRLGQDHYYGLPSLWTTGDAAEVLNVAKDLATTVGSSMFSAESFLVVLTWFLFLIGLAIAIRKDMRDFDDMAFMGCLTVFVASFKFSPFLCFLVLYLFVAKKDFVRTFIGGGRQIEAERMNHPAFRWIAGACLTLSPFYYLGYISAYHRGSAYVSNDSPQYVMIQKYGDFVMTEPATLQANGKPQVLNVTSGLKWFKLGEKETPIFYFHKFDESTVDGWRAPSLLTWVWIP